jgi:hypothetical protein
MAPPENIINLGKDSTGYDVLLDVVPEGDSDAWAIYLDGQFLGGITWYPVPGRYLYRNETTGMDGIAATLEAAAEQLYIIERNA